MLADRELVSSLAVFDSGVMESSSCSVLLREWVAGEQQRMAAGAPSAVSGVPNNTKVLLTEKDMFSRVIAREGKAKMKQRTWLITGVNSGFGRYIIDQLLARGDRLADHSMICTSLGLVGPL